MEMSMALKIRVRHVHISHVHAKSSKLNAAGCLHAAPYILIASAMNITFK